MYQGIVAVPLTQDSEGFRSSGWVGYRFVTELPASPRRMGKALHEVVWEMNQGTPVSPWDLFRLAQRLSLKLDGAQFRRSSGVLLNVDWLYMCAREAIEVIGAPSDKLIRAKAWDLRVAYDMKISAWDSLNWDTLRAGLAQEGDDDEEDR